MLKFFEKLNPFGKKEDVLVSKVTADQLSKLVKLHPHLWNAVRDTAFCMMNKEARKMVVVTDQERNKFANRIQAIDDFLKELTGIAMKVEDSQNGLDDIMNVINNELRAAEKKNKQKAVERAANKENDLAYYMTSQDLSRDEKGRAKVTITRGEDLDPLDQPPGG